MHPTEYTGLDMWLATHQFLKCHKSNKGRRAGFISKTLELGTRSAPLVCTSANVVNIFAEAAMALDEHDTPARGRYIVMHSDMNHLLFGSSVLSTILGFDVIISDILLPNLHSFQTYSYVPFFQKFIMNKRSIGYLCVDYLTLNISKIFNLPIDI